MLNCFGFFFTKSTTIVPYIWILNSKQPSVPANKLIFWVKSITFSFWCEFHLALWRIFHAVVFCFNPLIMLSRLWGIGRFKGVWFKSALAMAQNISFLFGRLRKYFFNSETCVLYKLSKFWNPLLSFCLGNENLSIDDFG